MDNFNTLLDGSANAHGHLCPGQVVGVRMAMLGCRMIELSNPSALNQIKKLIVYVEMDRCTADAVSYVTGVKLGRRSLKFKDYGIMAATFFNIETKKAVRVLSTEESRELASIYAPEIPDKYTQQTEAYKRMPENVLFRAWNVSVRLDDSDMPGPTRYKTVCSHCGQVIRDRREVIHNGRVFCKPCTDDAYFINPREIILKQDVFS
ncbi:MAG: formylmethanofuran dehydrogenase [Deltaproteobacteria bacterium]|nr:formylmethanofuran dehydrogenase [Deltaproteobacteria bacterium]